jgi:hydroxymethylpyrimidine pyrophosphatase-like HAD family hydrolase
VLAIDYDGTIAVDGALDPQVKAAIAECRAAGVVVLLVTGRTLSDLRALIGDLRLFDAIVAENGALCAFPRAGRSSLHAARCPAGLLEALRERGLGARAGECVVELEARDAHAALDVVRERELPLALHFNRERLMLLPQAVSKASGLREALRALRLSPHNAVGIGDAENDHELLAACEIGAAVAWGSPALRAAADVVVEGDGPAAVAGWLRTVVASPRIRPPARVRRRLVLGRDPDGQVLSLAVRGRNALVAGDPRSGKSWVAGLLCEQLVLHGYCVCVIDPEGDYAPLEALPGVVLLGGDEPPPSMPELARVLRHSDLSAVLDLSRLEPRERREYALRALRTATELRRECGLPHRIVVDEAHYFLQGAEEAHALDLELAGYTLITYRASGLHEDVLAACECVVVTGETDPAEARLLHERFRGRESPEHWQETLAGLELDEAVLLPGSEEAGERLLRFRLAPRMTEHVRHRHKYLDVPVGRERAFHFQLEGGGRGPVAGSLQALVDALLVTPQERLRGHVRRGDFSRWIGDVFRDVHLAGQVRALEERHRLGTLPDFNDALVHAVQERYRIDGPLL